MFSMQCCTEMPGKEIIGLCDSDPKPHAGQGKGLAADFTALLLQTKLGWPDIKN